VGTEVSRVENLVKYRGIAAVFAAQGQRRQQITIEAKFDEEEYTAGILSHAKIGHNRRRGGYRSLDFYKFGQNHRDAVFRWVSLHRGNNIYQSR